MNGWQRGRQQEQQHQQQTQVVVLVVASGCCWMPLKLSGGCRTGRRCWHHCRLQQATARYC